MNLKSIYKFHTPNTSEVPSRPVSKQRLLRPNIHEFLCIDRSFSEDVFYSFPRTVRLHVNQFPTTVKVLASHGYSSTEIWDANEDAVVVTNFGIHACALCEV